MLVKHLKSLLYKLADIQKEIEREKSRLLPNSARLVGLKKMRLSIKDRINQIAGPGFLDKGEIKLRPVLVESRNKK
jgi:uncharacterized protein YdcH (DUF465 family)